MGTHMACQLIILCCDDCGLAPTLGLLTYYSIREVGPGTQTWPSGLMNKSSSGVQALERAADYGHHSTYSGNDSHVVISSREARGPNLHQSLL